MEIRCFIIYWGVCKVPVGKGAHSIVLMKKHELLDRAKEIYPNPVCMLQKIGDTLARGAFHMKILFFPIAHTELTPIEMFYSKLKRYIATTNMSFRLSSVEQSTEELIDLFTELGLNRYVEDVLTQEDKYRTLSTNS